MEETLEDWNHKGGKELAGLLFEKATVAEFVAERNDVGLLAMSVDERGEGKVYIAGLNKDRSSTRRKAGTHGCH